MEGMEYARSVRPSMSDVAVIVPFAGDEPYRLAAAERVRRYYDGFFPGWNYVVASPAAGDAAFSRAAVLNATIARTDSEVIVFNDADSLVEPHAMRRAAQLAGEEHGLVHAYTRYRRLSRAATERLSMDAPNLWSLPDAAYEWEMVNAGSQGCAAISRYAFDTVGGLDECFVGWGYEDLAFMVVCEAHWPLRRVAGDLVHLWHPPSERSQPDLERANEDRYFDRYVPLRGDRERLRALVGA